MNNKKDNRSELERKSARAGLLMIIVAALTIEITAIVQLVFSQNAIREESSLRAESELESTKIRIMDIINQAEAAVRNSVWIAQWCLDVPDSMGRVTQRIVQDNPGFEHQGLSESCKQRAQHQCKLQHQQR